MSAEPEKFEKEDLPKILMAIQECRKSGEFSRLLVDFSPNGGVLTINVEKKKKYK